MMYNKCSGGLTHDMLILLCAGEISSVIQCLPATHGSVGKHGIQISYRSVCRLSGKVRCAVSGCVLDGVVNRYVGVDILASYKAVEEEVGEHCHYQPVRFHIAYVVSNPVLNQRHHAAADNHHHEYARCLCRVLAEALYSEVEDAAPHYRCAEAAEHEEECLCGHLYNRESFIGCVRRHVDGIAVGEEDCYADECDGCY